MCPQSGKSLWSRVMVHCSFCCQFLRATCSFYLWALPKTVVAGFPFTFWCYSIFRIFLNILFPKQTPAYWSLCVTQSVAVMWQLHIICRRWKMKACNRVLFASASQPVSHLHSLNSRAMNTSSAGAWSSVLTVFPRCTKEDQAMHLSLPLMHLRTGSSVCRAWLSAH